MLPETWAKAGKSVAPAAVIDLAPRQT